MDIGPDEALVAVEARFAPDTPASEAAAAVRRAQDAIRERFPKLKRIYIDVPDDPAR
jgi:hypothetical protein